MNSFSELPLIEPLQKAVKEEGYTVPTPIQVQSIPHLLEGRDLLGCAQTGTGKTAAFVLPILQKLWQNRKPVQRGTPRALILAPTRELAAQIGQSIRAYGKHLRITSTVIFGGVSQHHQVIALGQGAEILVATPGRLIDLVGQRYVNLGAVEILVLDEADRMLDMGFIHAIRKIIPKLPQNRQSIFLSATLEPAVVTLAKTLVHNPVHITVTPEEATVDRIEQCVYFVDRERKDALLISLLSNPSIKRVIVFTQMKHVANRVETVLNHAGIRSDAIHGNKSQAARTKALESFRRGIVRVLVATDIAARGIDIDEITHIINYELPHEAETYVHRIGRTARASAEGDAISFCSAPERDYLRAIERFIHQQIRVVRDHEYHSDIAMNAVGENARPPHKGGGWGRNRGQGGRPNHRGNSQSYGGHRRHGSSSHRSSYGQRSHQRRQ
ncbi:MAG TPA: DEAD/DEAH box helicase [Candidatus Nanoarchaeia archaeon]|nr:DEAD/DEAH box helicase [Candidatus Nanoarchaeia archaeon]